MTFIERVRFQTIAPGELLPEDGDDVLARFLSYWRGKFRDGRLPGRRDIDPMEIPRLLPVVILMDVLWQGGAAGDFRFSLIGQDVLDRYGPLKGRTLREQMEGPELHRTLEEHRLCVSSRLPVYIVNTLQTAADGDALLYQRLLLPLVDESDAVTSLAGIMAFRSYKG